MLASPNSAVSLASADSEIIHFPASTSAKPSSTLRKIYLLHNINTFLQKRLAKNTQETAREEKNYPKVLSRFIRPALLIIDEWLLIKVRLEDVNYIFEVIHKRCGHGSLILCSQFREEGWYDRLGVKDSPLADAIMDRIKHTAYQINIVSKDPAKDISMRELYGLSPIERE